MEIKSCFWERKCIFEDAKNSVLKNKFLIDYNLVKD
jgi:hypothetical protein